MPRQGLAAREQPWIYYEVGMIVALHAATGAATGALTRSRLAALAIGPVLHIAGDRVPHRHPAHSAWEYLGGIFAMGILAERRGAFDVATIGAAAAVMPDFEHVVPGLRERGVKVFHRRPGRGRRRRGSTGVSVGTQTLLAAMILAPLLGRRLRTAKRPRPEQRQSLQDLTIARAPTASR
jgi:hypothetical protein